MLIKIGGYESPHPSGLTDERALKLSKSGNARKNSGPNAMGLDNPASYRFFQGGRLAHKSTQKLVYTFANPPR